MSQPADVSPDIANAGGATLADVVSTGGSVSRDHRSVKKSRSLWGNAWRQFRHHKLAMAGLCLLIFVFLATFVGNVIYPREIDELNFSAINQPPSMTYPFGTDSLGQDILARVLWGGRVSLLVGLLAAFVAISFGTVVGALAGFFGGFFGSLLMRITDMFLSLPQLPLLLVISFLYRDRMYQLFDQRFDDGIGGWLAEKADMDPGNFGVFVLIILVIAILNWMSTARLVRAQFLSLKEKEFVEAARSIGAREGTLMFKHILPNVMSPIIVAATLAVGAAIITESSLSFLGLGFPPDVPTWGQMLYEYRSYLQLAPYQSLIVGFVIFITVLSINYVGDGLRDALDPRKTS
ncbi:MAG: ABC transporter permease [Thermomicrobiales bacterium]|jgi:peptide/nickel transport system permease protein|nr:ABC transporter permease [Thermomicrobiales bacterium]